MSEYNEPETSENSSSVPAPPQPKPDPELPEILTAINPDTEYTLPQQPPPVAKEEGETETKTNTIKKKIRLKKKMSNKKVNLTLQLEFLFTCLFSHLALFTLCLFAVSIL